MTSSRTGAASPAKVQQLYEEAVAAYGPALKRLSRAYESDSERRRDLLQDIHMALWESLGRFDGRCTLGTWVYRVAHNTALTFTANRRRRDGREQPGEPAHEPAAAPSQEREAIEGQRRRQLWDAVQALPVEERQIVVLYLEGLSAAEIEAITGVSAGAVATRLTRTRQKLAAQLQSEVSTDKPMDGERRA